MLAQKSDFADPETGASYTIKKYRSKKIEDLETGWRHASISLEPINPDFSTITISYEESDDLKIVAFFIEVIV